MSNKDDANVFLMVIKGVTLTVLISLICVLVFALIVKFTSLSYAVIKGVNQFLKIFSIFIGTFFSVKGKLGFVKGALVGLFSTVITLILFSLIGGEGVSQASFFIDTLFGTIIGLVCGVIAVQRKGQEE